MAPRPVTLSRQVRIDLPAEEVWQIVSQTSKVNHAIGLPELSFSERTNPGGQREIVGKTRKFGVSVQWVEQSFEWVSRQYAQVERVFERTPFVRSVVSGVRMQAAGSTSTIVETFATIYARDPLGKLIGRIVIGMLINDHKRYLQELAAKVAGRQTNYFPPARRVKRNEPTLMELTNRLRNLPVNQPILDRLLALIRTGRDEDVSTMRPSFWPMSGARTAWKPCGFFCTPPRPACWI
jgi:hypothetical protein